MNEKQALDLLHDYIAEQANPSSDACHTLRRRVLRLMKLGHSKDTNECVMHKLDWQIHWYASTIGRVVDGETCMQRTKCGGRRNDSTSSTANSYGRSQAVCALTHGCRILFSCARNCGSA